MNKLFLLAIVFSVVLSLGLVIACGDDDDDDDNDTADDDTGGDDDDTAGEDTCATVFGEFYGTCGYTFTDTEGNAIELDSVIAACEAGDPAEYALDGAYAACIIDADGDCDAMAACIEALL